MSAPFAVTTIAGSGAASSTDGTGLAAEFNNPHGIETDGSNLFITEYNGQRIRRVGISTLTIVTIAGANGYQDGTGASALLGNLGGITTDGNRLYFVDSSNNALRRIDNAAD
jgi:sugar lactone lactonase YvrE